MKSPEQLQAFVKKKLKFGYPEGELRQDLLKEGYSEEEIHDAFSKTQTVKGAGNTGINDFPLWYVVSWGFFITGITLLGFANGISLIAMIFFVPGIIGIIIRLSMTIKP